MDIVTHVDSSMIRYKPLVTSKEDGTGTEHLGVFDRMYRFLDDWSPAEEDMMIQWLTFNCTENFIFSCISTDILAGGRSDPIGDWLHRRKGGRRRNKTDLRSKAYHIKLHKEDVVMFEMVWLTEFMDGL